MKARIVCRPARHPLRPSWAQAAVLAFGVVLLHALLLRSFQKPGGDEPALVAAPLKVRSVQAPPPPKNEPPPAVTEKPLPQTGPARRPPPATSSVPAEPALTPVPATPVPVVPASTLVGDIEVPVYATRLPPPFEIMFSLERGGQSGEARLNWVRDGDHYQLQLNGGLNGAPGFESTSTGDVDGTGVAPLRFVDRRAGRGAQAVNFQREAGKITFSGPATEYPLVPGSQDRLSWVVQLAGILKADPSLATPGRQVTLYVAGARGDADVWVFSVEAPEPVGNADAVKLVHESRRPYDTRAEVWLDPARHFLPLHVRLSNGEHATDMLLRSIQIGGV